MHRVTYVMEKFLHNINLNHMPCDLRYEEISSESQPCRFLSLEEISS